MKDLLYWLLLRDDTIADWESLRQDALIVPVGDSIDWNGYRIAVLRADRKRAKLLFVRKA